MRNKWLMKIIIYLIFIGVVICTAEVDWAQENASAGFTFRLVWLIILTALGVILPIMFMYVAGNEVKERNPSEKKWFGIALILFLIGNSIPIVFYMVLGQPPGFFIFLLLCLFGLVPAFIIQPKDFKKRCVILIVISSMVLIPLSIFVSLEIDNIWASPLPNPDNSVYYMLFWGLFCVFYYLFLAMGWKFGGGSRRDSWNIYVAGAIVQFSALEDFLFFLLNGAALPGSWPWLENFVIDLKALFGHVPTDLDLLIFCIIMNIIALFILFDVHGKIYDKIKQN